METGVRDWLLKHGYSTELRAGTLLRARGWHVEHATWFTDLDSGKYRELDIRASVWDGVADELRWVTVSLAIECKRSDGKPWVVFTAPRDTTDLQVRNAMVADDFSRDLLYSVRPEVGMPECLRPSHTPGHGVTRAFTDTRSNDPTAPYAALRGVLSAANALGRENERFALSAAPEHTRADLVLPLVVLDGELYRYWLDDQDQDQVQFATWLQTTIASPVDGSVSIVTIVALPYLGEYLDSVEPQLRRFCTQMIPHISNVHGLARARRDPDGPLVSQSD